MTDRRSVEIPGVELHKQPFPAAVRIGNMIFSSAVPGMDRETRTVPDDAEAQIANAFANIRTLVEEGGGTLNNVAKVQVFLTDRELRPVVNKYWTEMFPDEHSRPVRHTVGGPLPLNYVIQLEFVAVL